MALSPLAPYVVIGVSLLLGGAAIARATDERAGRLLGLFLVIEGLHQLAHGAPALTSSPAAGQALLNTLHIPSYFGFAVGALLVSTLTGIHQRIWWSPLGMALLLVGPLAFTAVELWQASPFWTFSLDGAHALEGPLAAWSSLEGAIFLAFDLYFITVLLAALRRCDDPRAVPGEALVLTFFLLREVPVVVDFLSNPARWQFLQLADAVPPPLMPAETWLLALAAAAIAALPLLATHGNVQPAARDSLVYVCLLTAIVSPVVVAGASQTPALVTLRLAFGGILLAYAAIRHGILGPLRHLDPSGELPLAAAALGLLILLSNWSLQQAVPSGLATSAGIAVALVAGTLTITISGAGPLAASTSIDTTPGPTDEGVGRMVLDRYRLDKLLARGGSASTFLARDLRASRAVVVKIFSASAGGAAIGRETAALASIRHDRVVAVHQAGATPQGPALVMEYLSGGSLADRLRLGPLVDSEFTRLARDLLAGLGAVHGAGLVHGDVKPANILLTAGGAAKVGDFDVAHADPDATLGAPAAGTGGGTPRFLSPERARGGPATVAADLWAAGATLLEARTGTPLVEVRPNEGVAELLARIAGLGPFDRHVAGAPAMAAWFARALHPDPQHRFASAGEMATALEGASAAPAPHAAYRQTHGAARAA